MGPFHEGERAVQHRAGQDEAAHKNGRLIADAVHPSAWSFLQKQSMIAVGRLDSEDRLWASLWFGEPGFVRTDDGRTLRISHSDGSLRRAEPIGLCAIDLGTRRRFRVNGTIEKADGADVEIAVREAYPNCTQYIQRRQLSLADPRALAPDEGGERLDAIRVDAIGRADTLFVASRHPRSGADVSHRGGAPGFVAVLDQRTLRIPDYAGNGMFNTLGNLHVDPRAGIAVMDFDRGRVIQLTGKARLHFDREHLSQPTGGTGRYWDFVVERFIEVSMPGAYRWEFVDASPYNP